MAAKWCTSLDSSFDRSTLLCESILPRKLRKEVLVPLRKALELPEVHMADKQSNQIAYDRVDSLAMKFHKEKFLKHDGERIINIIEALNDRDDGQVAELQWKRMVDDLSKPGKFKNCLAVSDVSKNMKGVPMEASLAFGLLVSELSEEPWKGKIITFSENPQLHVIKGDDLKEKIEFVKSMESGKSANFQKVFDLILQVAVRGNLKEEEMIKRVFVFSDMEFDQASGNIWDTDYDVITRKFSEKGYGKAVPEIVFWNLRDSASTPVPATQKGVALVSGFSKNLLKIFVDNNGEFNPEGMMEAAISGEEYKKLVVD
ncbi:hypothetical protein TIFTF001_018505 [Ficus carica]|uniref:Uncharacterized protein n=1 Tax=Ficus carica TaxID=3494 RepID=A0AA88AS10_FICCA|nr:hypothetical protein TIFTF001_018505 [Ficus carica]